MKTWKRAELAPAGSSKPGVRWGHVNEDVEEPPGGVLALDHPRRFNGATSMKTWKSTRSPWPVRPLEIVLQWGHVNEDVEEHGHHRAVHPTPTSFNGATSMKTWKRSEVARKLVRVRRFNGATSMKTWKRAAIVGLNADKHLCFNGATSMKTWKRKPFTGDRIYTHPLQWGHVNEDVEEDILDHGH